jgi:uncharacterized protein (TIGR00369 family)
VNLSPRAPGDPDCDERVRESFARQAFMATIGAGLARVAPGEVDIRLPVHPGLVQQHDYVHAAALAAIGDSACGYAALSLMPPDADVVSIEFKINLLVPAVGETLLARGRVLRSGRTVTVCHADIVAIAEGQETLVATLTGTMMAVRGRPEVVP